jgi:hypothetical protein
VLAVPFVPSQGLAQCTVSCGDSLPPQVPSERSYDDFVKLAYYGAYGRWPTCTERNNEYNLLSAAASNGTLGDEAKRFVATLFETQTSYDTQDLTTYTQTSAYETRNPAANTDRTSLQNFVTDLYHAFLQRDPDDGGLCFWTNDACSSGRKHVIDAFVQSIEFSNLIGGLYDAGAPDCSIIGPPGDQCPGSGGGYGQLCS